jgi:carbon monoxide dehydrogenase subunit G
MKIVGNTVVVNAEREKVFEFLMDSNNLIHLLPQDKISDFKSSVEMCSFKVQGGVIISLVQDGSNDQDVLFMKSGENSPFPFRLSINIKELDGKTEGNIEFNGEVNMFLKMMVEKPLTNLFNYMANKLVEQF